MTKGFAFYGRVSTEDQQDPASSRQWQIDRGKSLIEPHGGKLTAEFFDVGQSRSLPWKRRPQASLLLDALRDPTRGFDAVVIGEPARAFYGNQFGLTFPVFVHYGVELWVPEVGGKVDPGSDAHDLVMSLYGGMSKGERNRIKIRVRSAMAAQAHHEGRFLGGRPPYGYRLADAGAHPNSGKAAMGARLHRLETDDFAAPIVARIFDEYLSGKGLYAIAETLTRDGIPSPSAHDPARNRHREGRAWGKSAVRAILLNPRYTGRQVWNKQRRDEVLIDVEDVAAGHETKLRWNDQSDWIWSVDQSHEAIVSSEDFARVQEIMAAGSHRPTPLKGRATGRSYALSGLVWCTCHNRPRRMQGTFSHDTPRYRCTYATEYAVVNEIEHAKAVYLREDAVVPRLDTWIAELFDPVNLDRTCEALQAVGKSGDDDATAARAEAARRKIADCNRRLGKYRDQLDRGTDPAIVTVWIREVQGERLRAEAELGATVPGGQLTKEEIRALVFKLRDIAEVLATTDPKLKQEVYRELGVQVHYDPHQRTVCVSAGPCTTERVGGGT